MFGPFGRNAEDVSPGWFLFREDLCDDRAKDSAEDGALAVSLERSADEASRRRPAGECFAFRAVSYRLPGSLMSCALDANRLRWTW